MSDFLFACPSFWSGVARVIDIGATFDGYNRSRSEQLADARGLYLDWRAVGEDLLAAFTLAKRESSNAAREDVEGRAQA